MAEESHDIPQSVSQEYQQTLGKEPKKGKESINQRLNALADKLDTIANEAKSMPIPDVLLKPQKNEAAEWGATVLRGAGQTGFALAAAEYTLLRDLVSLAAKATGGRKPTE